MFPKCAPSHMLERGGVYYDGRCRFPVYTGFLEPWQDGSSLSSALPSFWFRKIWNSRGRSRKRSPWCQKDFLALPFGALKLQISLVAEDMRCWGWRRWDTGVSSCWEKWLE